MATSTNTENPTEDRFEKFLNERISKTAQQVKWVDLFSFGLLLTIGVLTLLFGLCLLDAWVIELRQWMRWVAFATVVCGGLAFIGVFLLPFFFKRINPLYAAKKMEDSRPELKNSVINYLTTTSPAGSRSARAIRKKLSQKAAADVANIPLDLTVDRSRMIVAGYVLAGLVAVFALYKIISPKDPFQTIGRVILPTSDLTAPARVSISELVPGDDEKYFGESLEISAKIKGLRADEFPRVLVTTDDGRQKDFVVPMQFDESGAVYRATVGEGDGGLQESIRYCVVAGDATSPLYRIDVRTCPTIFIESIEYFSPGYTGIPDQLVQNPDLISGVEGAVAKVIARTNLPIDSASIELFRETRLASGGENIDAGLPPKTELKLVRRIGLGVDSEKSASGDFILELNNNRTGPLFTHYQLVFRTADGDASENPTLSRIEIIPDLAPEIQFVLPQEKSIEIPLDQSEKLEVTSVDPDYRLTRIQLLADCKGNRLFEKDLFRTGPDDGRPGKQVAQFDFSPSSLGLQVGDEVVLFASAEDNRTAGKAQVFDPLRRRTENYKVLITDPLKQPEDQKSPSDSAKNSESPKNTPPKNTPNNEDPSTKDSSKQDQPKKEKPSNSADNKQSKNDKGESKSQSEPSEQAGGKQSSKDNPEKGKSGQSAKADPEQKQPGQSGSDGNQSPKSGKNSEPESGGNPEPKSGKNSGEGKKQKQSGGGKSEESAGDPKAGGNNDGKTGQQETPSSGQPENSGKSGGNSPNEKGSDNNGTRDSKGKTGNPEQSSTNDRDRQSGSEESVREKANNSREAFDRLKEYFDKNKNEQSGSQAEPSNDKPEPSSGNEDKPDEPKATDAKNAKGSNGENSNKKDPSAQKQESPGKGNQEKSKAGESNSDSKQKENSQKEPGSGVGSQKDKKSKEKGSAASNPNSDNSKKESGSDTKKSGSPNRPKSGNDSSKPGKKESGKKQPGNKESGSKEPGNKESGSKEPGNKESGNKESGSKEPGNKGSGDSKLKTNQTDDSSTKQGDTEKKNQNAEENGDPGKKGENSKKGDGEKQASKSDASGKKESKNQRSPDESSKSGTKKTNSGGKTGEVNQADTKGNQKTDSDNLRRPAGGDAQDLEAEKANLEYARKATEMVLDRLKDKKNVEQDLLDELNWTPEELREFAKRWEAMRSKAESGSQADKDRFTDALRSLGLSDPSSATKKQDLIDDRKTGYRQKSGVRKVPSDYAKKFRAIQKSQRTLPGKRDE